MKRERKTVILVTHDMESVQRFCNRAILIDKGKIRLAGNASKVAQLYRDLNDTSKHDGSEEKNTKLDDIDVNVSMDQTNKQYNFTIDVTPRITLVDVAITFVIRRDSGEWIYRYATDDNGGDAMTIDRDSQVSLEMSLDKILADGIYYVCVAVKKSDRSEAYAALDDVIKFEVINKKSNSLWQIPARIKLSGVKR